MKIKVPKTSKNKQPPNTLLPAEIRKRLREIVCPPGVKGSWMQHLDDKQLSEIYMMLRSGKSATFVAKHVQDEWHVFEDIRTKNLSIAITNFRREALGEIYDLPDYVYEEKRQEALEQLTALRAKGTDVVKKIDAIGALADLVILERSRIEMRFSTEQITGNTDGKLSNDVQGLAQMLDTLAALQVKVGILDYKAQPQVIQHQIGFQGALASLPDGGVRLTQAANVFLDKIGSLPTKQLVQKPDGTFGVEDDDLL